ncbi:MAG: SurA N-terminal domain-containing protein [Anaerotignaceae bacterium]
MYSKVIFNKLILVLLVAILCGCSNTNVENTQEAYFISIDNREITMEEYLIYLDEAKRNFEAIGGEDIWETDFDGIRAIDVAKDNAYNTLVAVKIGGSKASSLNISLDEEQKKKAVEDAEVQCNLYLENNEEFSNLKELMVVIMEEKMLYSLVSKSVAANYIISESEYEEYILNYYESVKESLTMYTIQAIEVSNMELAQEVYNLAMEGTDYNELYEIYNEITPEQSKDGVYTIHQKDLVGEKGYLIDANKNYISMPVEMKNNRYVIYKILLIEESSDEFIKETLREEYKSTIGLQVFSQELEKWISATAISRDDTKWRMIE